jgi:hypothetical protein
MQREVDWELSMIEDRALGPSPVLYKYLVPGRHTIKSSKSAKLSSPSSSPRYASTNALRLLSPFRE